MSEDNKTTNPHGHAWRVRHTFSGHMLQIFGSCRPANVLWTLTEDLATAFDGKERARAVADAYIALTGDHDVEIVGEGE